MQQISTLYHQGKFEQIVALEGNCRNSLCRSEAGSLFVALAFHHLGEAEKSEAYYKQTLKLNKDNLDARYNYGLLLASGGRHDRALTQFSHVYQRSPNNYWLQINIALSKNAVGEIVAAKTLLKAAKALHPEPVEAHLNLGHIFYSNEEFDFAEKEYSALLGIDPENNDALTGLGNIAYKKENFEEAIRLFQIVINKGLRPSIILQSLGLAYASLGDFSAAENSFLEALKNKPVDATFYLNRANFYAASGKDELAISDLSIASTLAPNNADIFFNLGNILAELDRLPEALDCYKTSLSLNPKRSDALLNASDVTHAMGRHEESLGFLNQAAKIGSQEYLKGMLFFNRLFCCEWGNYQSDKEDLIREVKAGANVAIPLQFLSVGESEEDLYKCTTNWWSKKFKSKTVVNPLNYTNEKIRIGYISADFRDHAVTHLIAELIELHDRDKFQIFGFSLAPRDSSCIYQNRLVHAFDTFMDVSRLPTLEIVASVRQHQIDILIDLMGHTRGSNLNVFRYRPAPMQITWLGFPGTSGGDYFDYIIADRVVIPEDQASFYTEEVLYLPNSYQPNDSRRNVDSGFFTREDFQLPDDAVVYCCFNNTYKIQPPMFFAWARILLAVEKSVLWMLLDRSSLAAKNILRTAKRLGIDESRIIFAGRLPVDQHLQRLHLADVFLDTLPYNAHTTCSEFLWAGVPVVTITGRTFAGRVATSLLQACELGDLAVDSMHKYVDLCIRLGKDKPFREEIRRFLLSKKSSLSLFDSTKFKNDYEHLLIRAYKEKNPSVSTEGF